MPQIPTARQSQQAAAERPLGGRSGAGFPQPASGQYPAPDPESFVASPPDGDEILGTDPEHVAFTLRVYAAVLVQNGLSGDVARMAEQLA